MVSNSEERQLKARGNAGLVEDVRQMTLDCLFAQCELFGNIAIAASFHDAPHDFELAGSEPVGLLLRRCRLLHQVMESRNEIYDALAADPVVA